MGSSTGLGETGGRSVVEVAPRTFRAVLWERTVTVRTGSGVGCAVVSRRRYPRGVPWW